MIESVAIGSFDGIHIAHQALIKKVDGVVVIEHHHGTLTPGWKRSLYVNKPLYFYLLESIKDLTPEEFMQKLSDDFPYLKRVVVGYDFSFGKAKKGSIADLKEHFEVVEVLDEVKYNTISVHSRVIRELILNSNIELANRMLGRCYKIDGIHIKGQGIGSKELVPTINLKVTDYTLPIGVYVVNSYINSKRYRGVAFIGHRVTVDNSFAVEVHILDGFDNVIKDKVWIEFLKYIRGIQKFNSLKDLKREIIKDIDTAKSYDFTCDTSDENL